MFILLEMPGYSLMVLKDSKISKYSKKIVIFSSKKLYSVRSEYNILYLDMGLK